MVHEPEAYMQVLILVLTVLFSLGAALGTAAAVLNLLFRVLAKIR